MTERNRYRVRIRFRKQDDLRLVSHRDLAAALERMFRRCGLPLAQTEGFHPRTRMSFPAALALGIAGADEVMEVELTEPPDADRLSDLLRCHAPPGLIVASVESVPPPAPKLHAQSATYEIEVPARYQAGLAERIGEFMSLSSCPIHRPDRAAPIDLCANLEALALVDGVLSMRLCATHEAGARPHEILAVLGLAEIVDEGAYFTRTQLALAPS